MKIAFFTYYPLEYGGGVAKYYIEISSGLRKRYKDLDLDIITFDESTLKIIILIYSIYFFGRQDRSLFGKERTRDIKNKLLKVGYKKVKLLELKRELQKYSIIYSSNNLLEVLIFKYLIGYEYLPPVIYGFHIPSYYSLTNSFQSRLHNILYSSLLYKRALNGAKNLIVLNSFDEKMYSRMFSQNKITKIYNPFNFTNFVKKASKYNYRFNSDNTKYNILWVGRLTEQKGVDDLLKLINQINNSKSKNNIIWNIVGVGELKNKIEKFSKKWDNVKIHGYIENDYLASIYNLNDLFITTSKWESFPYNLLEAQSFGLPVVSFDINGCSDIIENGRNGYLVKSVDQFKDKVLLLINSSQMEKSDIKKFIRKKFSIDKQFQRLNKLIREA